jgi:hypothetical protein
MPLRSLIRRHADYYSLSDPFMGRYHWDTEDCGSEGEIPYQISPVDM